MQDKILSVFYGNDRLPYKDASRETHYPIVNGSVFNGANNVTKIRYYLDRIGGFENVTWVVVSKLPNGQLASEVLNSNNKVLDSELGEYYVEFEISSYYTTLNGDVYLSLQGYQGGVEMEQDEDTGIYSIYGTPTIQATGSIKIGVNYAPQTVPGPHFTTSDLQQVLGLISDKANISDVILVVDELPDDVSGYQDGQIFYNKNDNSTYILSSNSFLPYDLLPNKMNYDDVANTTNLSILYIKHGTKVFGIYTSNSLLFCKLSQSVNTINYDIYELKNNTFGSGNAINYYGGSGVLSTTLASILSSTPTKSYASQNGNNTFSGLNSFNGITIFNGNVVVPTPSANNQAANKEYIDNAISDFLQNEYTKVNTTTYPTLDDFLASTGDEGYIYLYPIDPSDETKGYYQYIWENNAWVSLGSTNIDLSGYVEKTTSANKVYATDYQGEQTTISVDDFYEGNIARRDSDNSITVPLTPTQNGHASSKKYVDDEISDLKNDIDTTLEDYAKVDGNYPTMTVGNADNLTPYGENSGAYDDTPFTFQTSGGSADIGNGAYLKALRGNSVAFNQFFKDYTDSSWYDTFGNSGTKTITATSVKLVLTRQTQYTNEISLYERDRPLIASHKYLIFFVVKHNGNSNRNFRPYIGGQLNVDTSVQPNVSTIVSYIGTPLTQNVICGITTNSHFYTGETIEITGRGLFDLTLMFGAGNEPTSVLEFNRQYPKPYYEYNVGTLLSCKVNGIKNVGYNAYDNSNPNNFIRVVSGQTYTLEGTYTSVELYDDNQTLLSDTFVSGSALPNNCCYVKIIDGNNTTCLHLTWDGSRTGYEPYEVNTYALPNIELRSAGSVYDELKPDGTLIRRIGVLNLGEQTWTERTDIASGIYQCNITGQKTVSEIKAICDKYSFIGGVYSGSGFASATNGQCSINVISGFVYVKSTSAPTSGLLYYELATPTEEQTTNTFQEIQDIDDFGTQEFLYDSDIAIPIPQGNDFFYPVDYKAFIDSLGGREDIEYAADQVVSQTQLTQALSTFLSSIQGYDATKTQTLKNVSGVFQWVED